MAKLTMKAIQDYAKTEIFQDILNLANEQNGVQFGNFEIALPVTVKIDDENTQEVWVTVELKAKNWNDTKQALAFNPYDKADEWKTELELKAKEKALKEEMKAKKSVKA